MIKLLRILSFFLLLIISSRHLYAEKGKKPITKREARAQINQLFKKSKSTEFSKSDSSLFYGEKALSLSLQHHLDSQIIKSHATVGVAKYYLGQYSGAIESYTTGLNLSKESSDSLMIAFFIDKIGVSYVNLGDYGKALDYFKKGLIVSERNYIRDSIFQFHSMQLSTFYNNLGVTYLYLGDLSESIHYYFKALKLSEKIGDKIMIANAYGNIGQIYSGNSEYEKSLEYDLKALSLFEEVKKTDAIAAALYNIASTYSELKNDSLNLKCLYKALSLSQQINDKNGIAHGSINLGGHYYKKKDFRKAQEYLSKGLKVSLEINNPTFIAQAKINLGRVLIDKSKDPKGINFIKEGATIAKNTGYTIGIKKAYAALYEGYSSLNNYEKAYEYQTLYHHIQDSLFNAEKFKETENLRILYEIEKKEQELELKDADIKLLTQGKKVDELKIYLALATILLLIVISSFIFYRQRSVSIQNKIQLEKQTLEKKQLNKEVEYQNKKLVDTAIYLSHRNNFLANLNEKIKETKDNPADSYKQLVTLISSDIESEKNRTEFFAYERQNQDFIKKIDQQFPDLTESEKQLILFIRMKIPSKEIASILSISNKSVEMGRYRVRKKLNLTKEENLNHFIENI